MVDATSERMVFYVNKFVELFDKHFNKLLTTFENMNVTLEEIKQILENEW